MEFATVSVRNAEEKHLREIQAIYEEAARNTSFNYETRESSLEERKQWLKGLTEKGLPVLVAEEFGKVLGFGALTPFHANSGYRFTVTALLYIASEQRGKGVGRLLAHALLNAAKASGFHSIVAGVNAKNLVVQNLLQSFGFEKVGHFRQIAFKHGEWHDDVCLQLVIEKNQRQQKE